MQSSLPFISVIIPTYNNERFIRFALESLFQQTYPEESMEIIVVDDGSTDNTYEVLEEFREKIIYIRQDNMGIAGARNKGTSMAKGEIITFLDADDIWYKERIHKVVETFNEKQDVGMVYHPIEVIDSVGSTIYENFYKAFGYKEGLSGVVTNAIFSDKIFCGGSSFAFKKEIINKICPIPEDIKRGIDYYMVVISSCYAPVEFVHDILGKYRLHGSNITMLAGQDNVRELAAVNKDFAYMREKVIGKISRMNINNNFIDINSIKRIQTKEIIFCNVLDGKRIEGIKLVPLLFKGNLPIKDLFKEIAVSMMAIFVPVFLYPKLIKMYGLLKRLKIIRL